MPCGDAGERCMKALLRGLRAALPWLVSGGLAIAVTLLVLAPAAWVAPYVAQATQGRARLIDADGSLWNGSAALALTPGADPDGATVLPGRLEWHTAFWPLLIGRLDVRVRQTEAMPDAITLEAGLRQGRLSAGSARLPASLLTGLGAPFNTLDLQADVRVQWNDWRWFGQQGFGHLNVTVADATSRVSTVRPLGTYQAEIEAQGARMALTLSTQKGPLMLTGHGGFGAGGSSFTGRASAAPEARENLAGLLNLIGRQLGDGSVALGYGGGGFGRL
jgi:general secretion pathway protein N